MSATPDEASITATDDASGTDVHTTDASCQAGSAVRTRSPRSWCLGTRLFTAAAAGWLAFAVARPLLSGRLAWWSLLDVVPPLALPAVAVLFAASVPALRLVRVRLPASARWTVLVLAAAALAVGFPQSGLNLAALGSAPPPAPAGALRVTVWDTVGWDSGKNTDAFYSYLENQHSDVYVIQEYIGVAKDGSTYPIDDTARLKAAFPGFHLAVSGELLTLSRYPVLAQHTVGSSLLPSALADVYGSTRILRTDLNVNGRVLSVYNVHLPDLFYFKSPFSPSFYQEASELTGWRNALTTALQADIAGNRNQILVGGDLNLVPGSAALGKLGGLQDAAHASRSLYPVSFWVGHLQAWRMDWTFASPDIRFYDYDLVDPQGFSTHRAQDVTLTFPGSA
jgi:endonuclease/exonuclease/phosphatase (EEP) superfamily protein YafD